MTKINRDFCDEQSHNGTRGDGSFRAGVRVGEDRRDEEGDALPKGERRDSKEGGGQTIATPKKEKWRVNGVGRKTGEKADLGEGVPDTDKSDWRRDGGTGGVPHQWADSSTNHSATRGLDEGSQRQRLTQHVNRGTDADLVGPDGRNTPNQNATRGHGDRGQTQWLFQHNFRGTATNEWAPLVAAHPLRSRHVASNTAHCPSGPISAKHEPARLRLWVPRITACR
ncbi:hypothetical protein VNO78_19955 [Psophocarpus tetragonolobus]|uniref:Uncharacterized protein n=1 Tax=Psophocarpus tetragonolobus TaxID=3891 RepID=A0AAN9XGN5_PSOTE